MQKIERNLKLHRIPRFALLDAVKIAFPMGGMTVAGLRREWDRDRLVIEKIAGKEFTTLAHIERTPRRSKGARLQLKAARPDKSGTIIHQATWIIRDNGRDVGTGCAALRPHGKGRRIGQDLVQT